MNQVKFYKITTLVFLILNISVISFFFITKPKPQHGPHGNNHFMKEVVKDLQLDKVQYEKFSTSAKKHNQKMVQISHSQKKLLRPYFISISNDNNDINKDSILAEVQKLEVQKVNETYLHFEEVKKLLNSEQVKSFDKFLSKAIRKIMDTE